VTSARERADGIIEDVIFDDLRGRGGIGDTLDDIKYNDEELWEEIVSVGRNAIEAALLAEREAGIEECEIVILRERDRQPKNWVWLGLDRAAAAIRALINQKGEKPG
jgi:hypothetical protein